MLRNLMNDRGFYPMVAAQKLNVTYPVMVAVAATPRTHWSAAGSSPSAGTDVLEYG
ncbi:lytic murein transglycosylase [Serratia odorifera]|uniref:Lytic murein transglycosylase n=1 Tax=Serratia odorifera TaxID=618 RepID=A0A447KME1_SEROD|nr:lytic murein transglycosylase [Serratia odorifera]